MQLQPISRITGFVADVTSGGLPWLLIRRLGQEDRAALAKHFIDLPRQDRRTRFGGNTSEEAIRRHCDGLDLDETVCFAALDAAGSVIGAALGFCYSTGSDSPCQAAEIAVSVAPEYRRRGLGADLVARVCDAVSAHGAAAAVFEFDPSNAAIVGLVRQLGGLVPPLADSCTIPLSTLH